MIGVPFRPDVVTYKLLQLTTRQWMINPTAETYSLVHEMSRPTLVQGMIPHRAVFDLGHHPALRDALFRVPRDFISPLQGVPICWPMQIDDAVETGYSDGALYLTDEFVRCALNTNNWVYSESFRRALPGLLFDLRMTGPCEHEL